MAKFPYNMRRDMGAGGRGRGCVGGCAAEVAGASRPELFPGPRPLAPAARPGPRYNSGVITERVARTIERHRMFSRGQRVGVAVSGGADSVCLLEVLVELAPRWGLALSVLHLEHGLRGQESREDAAFVAGLAGRLGLPFHLESVDVRALGGNLEQAAREARHGFFRRFVESGRLDRVALGHTLSDQAETVVFRFLRGAGTAGLSGVRPVTAEGLVRPLLDVARAEVEQYLRERGIAWREDSTNADPAFARNRIRHSLLPQLTREWNPALPQVLAQTAEWARSEEEYWQAELDRLCEGRLRRQGPTVILEREWLLSLPLAVARRVIRRVIEEVKGDLRSIDFAHIEAILALAGGGDGHGRLQAPGVDAMRSFEWLRLAPIGLTTLENRNYRLPLPVPGRVRLPPGAEIVTEIIENQAFTGVLNSVYNGSVGRLDWERISGTLDVRNWRPGDQYQPYGCSSKESIKSLFQQARVPLWERRHWPVVTLDDVIIWSRRFGSAAEFAAAPGTRKVLTISSQGELSG